MIHTQYHVGSEVLTAVVTKFYLLGYNDMESVDKSPDVSEEHVASILRVKEKAKPTCFIYSSTLKMEAMCDSRHRLTFNELHGIISQKTELFIHGTSFQVFSMGSVPIVVFQVVTP
jgi:hypothetical protein